MRNDFFNPFYVWAFATLMQKRLFLVVTIFKNDNPEKKIPADQEKSCSLGAAFFDFFKILILIRFRPK